VQTRQRVVGGWVGALSPVVVAVPQRVVDADEANDTAFALPLAADELVACGSHWRGQQDAGKPQRWCLSGGANLAKPTELDTRRTASMAIATRSGAT
jgi:hypothetical protein